VEIRTTPKALLVSKSPTRFENICSHYAGTDWAGGATDFSQGPFKMYLKSMTVTDYSTGSSYSYGDMSGTWESITSNGGKINGNEGVEPTSTESAPLITSTAGNAPVPWSGTHKETSSWVTPNVWPWVAAGSPTASSTGYQYDWESSSGQNKPPGGASASKKHPFLCQFLFGIRC
jgi:hypothetical protein